MNGLVVRGERGERAAYRPINEFSSIVNSSSPVEVIQSVKPKYVYIADLDRIMRKGDNFGTILKIKRYVKDLIADCGFRESKELPELDFNPVVGTETFDVRQLEGLDDLRRITVSVDILDELMDASSNFGDCMEVIEYLNSYRLKGVIILTLRRVGTSSSLDWELIEKVLDVSHNPVFVGGGVKSMEDVERARDMGCRGVLIATSVHNGEIPIEVVRRGEI